MNICVSIASYRDPDLLNTVNSAYEMAAHKNNISFCIVSQAEDDEHPDLSHIPKVYYYKYHWTKSRGLGWARNMAVNRAKGDYILQIDSHSRFKTGWDEIIEGLWGQMTPFWGERIIGTDFPIVFEIDEDGNEIKSDTIEHYKAVISWNKEDMAFNIGQEWLDIEDLIHGDEVFYIAGGCTFARSDIFKSVAADPEIYFEDQISITLRAYTRGIRLINFPESFVYSNYDRQGRSLHWEDHEDWYDKVGVRSERRLSELYHGELDGFYGIQSRSLYEQYLKINNIDFEEDEDDM